MLVVEQREEDEEGCGVAAKGGTGEHVQVHVKKGHKCRATGPEHGGGVVHVQRRDTLASYNSSNNSNACGSERCVQQQRQLPISGPQCHTDPPNSDYSKTNIKCRKQH